MTQKSAGATSATSRTTSARSPASTTEWGDCSTTWTTRVKPTTRSSCTHPTRVSSSGITAGSTNGSCTKNRSRMPFLIRYPQLIEAGSRSDSMVLNVDFAPTFCELAGLATTVPMQGNSFCADPGWRDPSRLADRDVLPLLDASRRFPPRTRPLRDPDIHSQTHLLLQRSPRSAGRQRAARPRRVGALRPRGGSAGDGQRGRPPELSALSGSTWRPNSAACSSPSVTRRCDGATRRPLP